MQIRYEVVDVFTKTRLEGNPLAVFPDAAGLTGADMQKIAREMNLSETTFVFAPKSTGTVADVRIFTPSTEMRFAGHPTIGTAFVIRKNGVAGTSGANFVLEEKVGPVAIKVDAGDDPIIWLESPPIALGREYDGSRCARVLGIEPGDLIDGATPEVVSAGNPGIFVAVKSRDIVDRVAIDLAALRELIAGADDPPFVFVFAPTAQGAYSRMFAPHLGVFEDPATGSATGPLARYMMRHHLAPHADGAQFISEQGTKMGRRSILHVKIRGENGSAGIDVGGHVRPIVTATMTL